MKRSIFIGDAISSLVLLLLLYTSLSKLANYNSFQFALSRSTLLQPFSTFLSSFIPLVELAITVVLFIPATREKGLYVATILISVFTIYLLYMISFSPDLACTCGGVLKSLTWPQHILFNLFFITIGVMGIVLYRKHRNSIAHTPP